MGYYRVLIAVVVVYLQMGAFYISKHLSWQWFSHLMAYHPEPEYSTCLISEKHPNTSLVTYPLWKFNHQKSVFWKREKCLSQKLHFSSLIQKKKTLPLFAFKLDILLNSSNTPFIIWINGRSVKTTKSSVKQRWVNCKHVGIYVG